MAKPPSNAVAMCMRCFRNRYMHRQPVRLPVELRKVERCHWCGKDTSDGIFHRRDPERVPFAADGGG